MISVWLRFRRWPEPPKELLKLQNLVVILAFGFDRYLELVHPMWHMTHFKKYWIYLMFLFSWLLGFGYNITVNVFINKVQRVKTGTANEDKNERQNLLTHHNLFQVVNETCTRWIWPTSQLQSIMGFAEIIVLFFVPLAIIIFCYGSITCVLSARINNNQQFSSGQQIDPAMNTFQQAKRNTLITFAIVAFCFVLCWSPNQILYLMYNLGYSLDFSSAYFNFTVLMVFLNCTINPFVYLFKYRDFQVALREVINCCLRRNTGHQTNSSTGPENNPVSVVSGKLSAWIVKGDVLYLAYNHTIVNFMYV